jgi:hypothetical protein
MRRYLAPLSLAALLGTMPLLAGCDPADAGTFELLTESVRFTFDIPSASITPGTLVQVDSRGSVDVAALVEARSFTMDDVVSVRITTRQRGPEVDLREPFTAGVNHLARVNVRGRVGATTGPILVSGTAFSGTGRRAPLDVNQPSMASALGGDGRLRTVLELEPTALAVSANYVVDVTFDIVVEVEG